MCERERDVPACAVVFAHLAAPIRVHSDPIAPIARPTMTATTTGLPSHSAEEGERDMVREEEERGEGEKKEREKKRTKKRRERNRGSGTREEFQ